MPCLSHDLRNAHDIRGFFVQRADLRSADLLHRAWIQALRNKNPGMVRIRTLHLTIIKVPQAPSYICHWYNVCLPAIATMLLCSRVPRLITDAETWPGMDCSRMHEIMRIFHGYFTAYCCDGICRLRWNYAMKYPHVFCAWLKVRGLTLSKHECAVHISEKLSGEYT